MVLKLRVKFFEEKTKHRHRAERYKSKTFWNIFSQNFQQQFNSQVLCVAKAVFVTLRDKQSKSIKAGRDRVGWAAWGRFLKDIDKKVENNIFCSLAYALKTNNF